MMSCLHSLPFRKATASGNNDNGPNCVEAAAATTDVHALCTAETCIAPDVQPGDIVVRDSKDGGTGPVVVFRAEEWAEYVVAVLEGAREAVHGRYVIRDSRTGVVLSFTVMEWDAFLDGCGKGEFTYHALSTIA